MSLADELLADLEEDGDADDENTTVVDAGNNEIEEITDADEQGASAGGIYDRVTAVARLRHSDRFAQLMQRLRNSVAFDRSTKRLVGPVEADPDYLLIVDLNQLASEIDHEINVIHKFVRDKYQKRFPELESLVPGALDYLAAVAELGNDIDVKAQHKDTMSRILLPATVIVVSVTASTTQGKPLTVDELAAINEACTMATELHEAKLDIYKFVEERMALIAPNLSTLVGAGTAAMLMGQAGGLIQLSKMPSCDILVLGTQRRTLAGFSSSAVLPHTGFVYYLPAVQALPPDLRRKGARLVSAKCTLAARIDAVHASPDGAEGRKLLEQVGTFLFV
jgi:U4/U6 small nuclear ribonucleoprotein PRP31